MPVIVAVGGADAKRCRRLGKRGVTEMRDESKGRRQRCGAQTQLAVKTKGNLKITIAVKFTSNVIECDSLRYVGSEIYDQRDHKTRQFTKIACVNIAIQSNYDAVAPILMSCQLQNDSLPFENDSFQFS